MRRFAFTLDELARMRPLVDVIEEGIARRAGQTLEQYRAKKAQPQPITQPRTAHDD